MTYYSYLLVLNDNNFDNEVFEEFLRSIISFNIEIVNNKDYLVAIYPFKEDLDIEENINAFIYDMNYNVKCYVSSKFEVKEQVYDHINIILNYFSKELTNSVYNEKTLLNEVFKQNLQDIKPFILKEYLYDLEFKNIVYAMVDNDLNVLKTSKAIFMHRNTLMNKIDRFYEKTGYDIRKFKDIYIIYSLLK